MHNLPVAYHTFVFIFDSILNNINQSSQLHFNITGNNAILTSTTEFTQISNMFLTKRQRDGEGQQLSGPGSNKLTKHCANNASHDVHLLPHSTRAGKLDF